MKVGFLINSYGRGGAQRVISLVSSRIDPELQVLMYYHGEKSYTYPGMTFSLDDGCGSFGKYSIIRILWRMAKLHSTLSQQKVTVLISFLVRTNVLSAFLKRLGLYRGKLILNEVTIPSIHRSYTSRQKWLLKYTYRWADKIVVPSTGIKNDLIGNYGLDEKKIIVIPNPIDSEAIRRSAENDFSISNSGLKIVAVGRLTASKRIDDLILAVSKAREKAEISLIIIGDGEEKEGLVKLACELGIESNIFWAGWVENPFSIMSKCDIFVLTSEYEGFGNVLIEAMCCGLPVISFDCPAGPREILVDNEFGILIENGNIESLADAIVKMSLNNEFRAYYKAKAQERIKDYEIDKVASIWRMEILGE